MRHLNFNSLSLLDLTKTTCMCGRDNDLISIILQNALSLYQRVWPSFLTLDS